LSSTPNDKKDERQQLPWFEVGNAEDSELSSYFSAVLEPGQRMGFGGFRAVPEVADMLKTGELDGPELETVWKECVGPQAVGLKASTMLVVSPGGYLDDDGVVVGADASQFVAAWRALEAMFEFDDIKDDDDEDEDKEGEDEDDAEALPSLEDVPEVS
jgi:hypothetical protein